MGKTATAPHNDFAGRLRSARLRVGKSQEQIAAEVGTSRRHWIRWEGGHNLPSQLFIAKIAEATGQTTAYLNGETVRPTDDGESVSDDDEEADAVDALMSVIRHLVREEMRRAAA